MRALLFGYRQIWVWLATMLAFALLLGVSVARAEDGGVSTSLPVDAGTLADADAGPQIAVASDASVEFSERTAPIASVQALEGLPLRAVDVVVDANTLKRAQAPALAGTGFKIGDPFRAEFARGALSSALSSGRFSDGSVEALAENGGVRLRIRLVPRLILRDVQVVFSAEQSIVDKDELLRDTGLVRDAEIVPGTIDAAVVKARAFIRRVGYLQGNVTVVLSDFGDALRVDATVQVDMGERSRITRRVLDVVRGDAVRSKRDVDSYSIERGSYVDELPIEAADVELQNKLRSHGWFDALVAHTLTGEANKGLLLRVSIDLGARYVTRFEGNEHYDNDALQGALGLEQETDRTASHLAEKLKTFYVVRGFLDAEVVVDERASTTSGPPSNQVRALAFRIDEHERVKVAKRSYACFQLSEREHLDVAPRTGDGIGNEIDSFLEEDLPGSGLFRAPRVGGAELSNARGGSRPEPIDINPRTTFAPAAYARAAEHIQDLYRADGFLNAIVGPVQVIRRRCSPKSPLGTCVPVALPPLKEDACSMDPKGLPLPPPDLDPAYSCVPDNQRGITCEKELTVRIPVKLGPRTYMYDAYFYGVRALSPSDLLRESGLVMGTPANNTKLDSARRAILARYEEEGYAFASIRPSLEPSLDHSRARVRFEVAEGEKVFVRSIVIRGNTRTDESVIRRRIALEVGEPYRASLVRKSQERIATLGTFSSVSIRLDEPFVPEKFKSVIVTVAERAPQVAELGGGFSTGEGFRVLGEYGHRNLFHRAISFSVSGQVSYLPTPLILDSEVRNTFTTVLGDPGFDKRTGVRVNGSLAFPETGLGPLFRGVLDLLFVHDLQRDYYVRKFAAVPSLTFTPAREFRFSLGPSVEYATPRLFKDGNVNEYIQRRIAEGTYSTDVGNALLVPDYPTVAFGQKLTATWDRRDNSLDATNGTLVAFTVEHVDAFPTISLPRTTTEEQLKAEQAESHLIKLSQTLAGYIPLYKRLRIALLLRTGVNVQLTPNSSTYPDRQFFMGGTDSMRAWYQSAFIPQDIGDKVAADANRPDTDVDKYTLNTRPIRGGNLLFNPRAEIRIPVTGPVETVTFVDIGNLWVDPSYPFKAREFPMRMAIGSGVRFQTSLFPIAFDLGFNPFPRSYDPQSCPIPGIRTCAINFSIGLF
ncbi:MAG: POTRA domain-containing protein [Polyangiaceae bacterium]